MKERTRNVVVITFGAAIVIGAAVFYLFFDYARASSFCDTLISGSDASAALETGRIKATRISDGQYRNERRVVFGKCYCAVYVQDTKVDWSRVLCDR